MKKKLIIISSVLLIFFIFSPFGIYKTHFDGSTILALPLTQFVMEGTVEDLDSADYALLHASMEYVTLENLNNIPIEFDPFGQHSNDENIIPLFSEQADNSSKIWAFIYQKSIISNQYEIEFPLTSILYQGKLISFKGSGNISVNGEFGVFGLCSLWTFDELLETSLATELRIAMQKELKKKIQSAL